MLELPRACATEQDPDVPARVQAVLDHDVRPFLQSHGGDVEVVAIDRGIVSVSFHAACGACELRPVTFAVRVRNALLRVPGVNAVHCDSVALAATRLDSIAAFFE